MQLEIIMTTIIIIKKNFFALVYICFLRSSDVSVSFTQYRRLATPAAVTEVVCCIREYGIASKIIGSSITSHFDECIHTYKHFLAIQGPYL